MNSSTLTEIALKEPDGQLIMRVFANHSSFDELLNTIDTNYEKRTGEKAVEWYIPMPDPVEGSDRELSSEEGYDTWIKYGQTRTIDAFLTKSSHQPKIPETGKSCSVIYAFSRTKFGRPSCCEILVCGEIVLRGEIVVSADSSFLILIEVRENGNFVYIPLKAMHCRRGKVNDLISEELKR